MIKSFLKIAFRFLWRNKTYSFLNFFCLTFGLTSSIIAVLYIVNVFSFDKFHKNYKQLHEIEAIVTFFNGDRFLKEPLSASLTGTLNDKVPEIGSMARLSDHSLTLSTGDRSFTENGIYADDNFFSMFSFPLVSGDVSNVLAGMNSIVISERLAAKLYGTTDCLGKTFISQKENGQESYMISGVFRDIPAQSYLQFDFIIPYAKFLAENNWANETGASAAKIWALLPEGTEAGSINEKIKDLIKNQESTLNQELFLFPLKEKVLYNYAGGKRVWEGMQNVFIVGSIGFAILMIACFNFINLAVALNIRRYRETGIKKVSGADKSTIALQFLGETFMITFISLFIAIILARLLVNGFNTMFNGNIDLRFTDFRIIVIFPVIAIITGLVSGLLPAAYLSSANPIDVLKGKLVTGQSYSLFRQSLIVFLFVIPVVLMICMMIIRTQESYLRNYNVGIEKDKLIVLDNSDNTEAHRESFKSEILSIPEVEAVSFTNCIPTRGARVSNEVSWKGKDDSEKLLFWCVNADYDYNKAVTVNIIKGRYFDRSFPSDSTCYVINDITADLLHYEDPVGQTLTLEGSEGTIIGVFKDFHAVDLAGPYAPTIITLNKGDRNNILIKYSGGTYSSVIEKIGEVYKHYETGKAFEPVLFRDLPSFTPLSQPASLVGIAGLVAILLACLGLSGLASFTTEGRTKEIGIRKANGATIISILRLLGTNYSKWLIISSAIALPIAFILGNAFLARFHFHTKIPVWAFWSGPLIAFSFALLSVSFQTLRAATKNPVEALRYE